MFMSLLIKLRAVPISANICQNLSPLWILIIVKLQSLTISWHSGLHPQQTQPCFFEYLELRSIRLILSLPNKLSGLLKTSWTCPWVPFHNTSQEGLCATNYSSGPSVRGLMTRQYIHHWCFLLKVEILKYSQALYLQLFLVLTPVPLSLSKIIGKAETLHSRLAVQQKYHFLKRRRLYCFTHCLGFSASRPRWSTAYQ